MQYEHHFQLPGNPPVPPFLHCIWYYLICYPMPESHPDKCQILLLLTPYREMCHASCKINLVHTMDTAAVQSKHRHRNGALSPLWKCAASSCLLTIAEEGCRNTVQESYNASIEVLWSGVLQKDVAWKETISNNTYALMEGNAESRCTEAETNILAEFVGTLTKCMRNLCNELQSDISYL